MQRLDFLWASEGRAFAITSAILEFDHIAQCRGLAIAEIRTGFRDLAQTLGAPQTYWNRLAAEVAVAARVGVVAEMSVHIEIAVGDGRVANQSLIEYPAGL